MESAAAVAAEHPANNLAERPVEFVEATTDTAQSVADNGSNTNASGSDSDHPQADDSDSNAAGSAPSLAERRKKLDALRSRMVRRPCLFSFLDPRFKNPISVTLRDKTVPPSLMNQPNRKQLSARPHGGRSSYVLPRLSD